MPESLTETLRNLREQLRTLREQLAAEQSLDAEQVVLLRRAADEIEETLERSDVNSHDLAEQMRNDSLSFSETHPVLVQTIGRIADLLSQMGI